MKTNIAIATVAAFLAAQVDATQLQRLGTSPEETEMLTTIQVASGFSWKITSTGVYDEDYGVTYIRLEHVLVANILADDKIVFDVGFTGDSAGTGFKVANLKDTDGSRCIVYQNLQSPNYWIQDAKDGYWWENTTDDALLAGKKYQWFTDMTTSQDWTNPIDDDSTTESEYFCQQPLATANSDYACTSIKCITQRPVTTADDTYDFNFAPVAGTPATMYILASRAIIYFQKIADADLTYPSFALTNSVDTKSISVMVGATYMQLSAFAIAAAATVSLF